MIGALLVSLEFNSMPGPSQPQVIDEVWTEDRIKSFLTITPNGTENSDFSMLQRAYRGMRETDFSHFLVLFQEAGNNLDSTNPSGHTLWEVIAEHRHGAPYIAAAEAVRST